MEDALTFSFERILAARDTEEAEKNAKFEAEARKEDRRFRSIVCRHWLRGLCQHGDQCHFVHQFDPERMPECRWGECTIPDCVFKHIAEADLPFLHAGILREWSALQVQAHPQAKIGLARNGRL